MANNKMLIDASHPEETRVVVVRGNRIEEFDFEAQERKQLRGNIYLAKVTRVEPSLQAAFIDYGGNRHGFLAFSEIHPDYYQIPAADRQALLEEEEAAAVEAAEAEAIETESMADEDEQETRPRSRKRQKSTKSRGRKASEEASDGANSTEETGKTVAEASQSSENVASENDGDQSSGEAGQERWDDDTQSVDSKLESKPDSPDVKSSEGEGSTESDAKTPKKRRTRSPGKTKAATTRKRTNRAKKADKEEQLAAEIPAEAEASNEKAAEKSDEPVGMTVSQSDDGVSGEEGSKTIAAIVEDIDSISEPAPDENDADSNVANEEIAAATEAIGDEEKPAPKKRKPRKPRKKTAAAEEKTESAEAEENAPDQEVTEASSAKVEVENDDAASSGQAEKPKHRKRKPKKKEVEATTSDETVSSQAESEESQAEEDSEKEAPKRSRTRRRKKPQAEKSARKDEGEEISDGDDDAEEAIAETSIESVGQEDALEEARIKRPRRQYKIQEVIRRRQVMLIQVVKEERGNKGAALTTYLSLAGRYSVLMPNTARGGGISRKITNLADRKRLKEIASGLDVPQGMGVILRTAGASRDQEEIQRDFDYLMRLWDNVRNLTLSSSAPHLVYEEGSLIKRSIRDLYHKDISEIVVSGEHGYQEARNFMAMLMPEHSDNVKLYNSDQPIFSKYNVESQLEKMVAQQVTLKSGGYLIINQTEALVAVDVNSGKSTREHSIEATALQTNLEAAEELARQLRLRDLAGLIVIDFIDMEEKRNNRAVERRLKECLKSDRARIQVGHISHFGLLEMSRQRIRASVLESTMAVCPTCNGVGHVRSQSSSALIILRALEDHLNRFNRHDVILKVSPEMALYILNNKRQALSEMEMRFGLQITVDAAHGVSGQEYLVERGAISTARRTNRKAVSMMHDSPSEQASQSQPRVSKEKDDEPSENRGRKRRGKRGRQNSEERAAEASDTYKTEEITSSEEAQEIADKASAKPTRRTKRKRSAEDGSVVTIDAEQGTASVDSLAKEDSDTGSEEEINQRAARPSRRTGRPGKKVKPVSGELEETEETEEATESTEETEIASSRLPDAEPPRPARRRNTRRVKSVKDGSAPLEGSEEHLPEQKANSTAQEEKPNSGETKSRANSNEEPDQDGGWSGFLT